MQDQSINLKTVLSDFFIKVLEISETGERNNLNTAKFCCALCEKCPVKWTGGYCQSQQTDR